MQQLTQTLKDGFMEILEVPFPALEAGSVLVRNHFSVISAGTERKTVKDARLGYIRKAWARRKEARQVLNAVLTQGPRTSYEIVMTKLAMPSALGYSCAGEVIAVGGDVTGFKVRDWVACGGSSAAHAEVVAVPKHLCARVPEGVDLREAAFTTLASIALHGVRQADVRLGENCVVVGLGLVGLLTAKLLDAAGVQAIGIDIDPEKVKLAKACGVAQSFARNHPQLEEAILESTGGHGADAVIITADTSSSDPVELAGRLSRKKGRVVIVGNVPTDFPREHYYKKELDLRMSCSYGPGRYDADYEEKGVDYPIGYVRWTENRNMQAFLDLLASGKLDIERLITHKFDFEEATRAYPIILDRSKSFAGILLKYDLDKPLEKRIRLKSMRFARSEVHIGFIGAGSFAQRVLLPAAKKQGNLVGLATARPNSSRGIADKHGFSYCTGDGAEITNDENINTVFIATRHNLHAPYVLEALRKNKNIFVEKPLCLSLEGLQEIAEEYQKRNVHLMVDFNRRFSPHVRETLKLFSSGGPKAIHYRINAGSLPPQHWVHDKDQGGGRILGEVCHFVDLAMFLAGSRITTVSADSMGDSKGLMDTLVINLTFADESVASISYFSNGHPSLQKERLEIFSAGQAVVIDDFKRMTIHSKKTRKYNLRKQDKGHARIVEAFLSSVTSGTPTPIPFEDIYWTTLATLKVVESIQSGQKLSL